MAAEIKIRIKPLAASIIMLIFALLLSWAYTTYAVNRATSEFHQAEKSAQVKSAHVGHLLCESLNKLASIPPPPPDAGRLTRDWLEKQSQVLDSLGPDIGCPK